MAKFKREILQKIQDDPELFAKVATELEIKPTSLPLTLRRNNRVVNQYSIVKLVAEYLGVDADSLMETETV